MMEIVYAVIAILGLMTFISFLLFLTAKLTATPKVKRRKRRKKSKEKKTRKPIVFPGILEEIPKEDDDIPKEWRTTKQNPTSSSVRIGIPKKVRIPGLRTSKRILALTLLILNFVIAQVSLMSAPEMQPMFWLFFLNALIILDYLWKTRRRSEA